MSVRLFLSLPLLAFLQGCTSQAPASVAAHETRPAGGTPSAAPVAPSTPTPVERSPSISADQALAALQSSTRRLEEGWRFRQDPTDQGLSEGWSGPAWDDSGWAPIRVGQTWEEQGHAGDGLGWYRISFELPEDWSGAQVHLVASGVDDEYDVFVNGERLRHFGEAPDRSVWNWRTLTRIDGALKFGGRNVIALRVNDWGNGGGVWREIHLRRSARIEDYQAFLPGVVLEENPEWVRLYWEAWRLALDKLSFGTAENGFVHAYMDEGFNEQIYQWDSSFIAMFGRYGTRLFPAMATLDNFYRKQRADGYIQRVYSETNGEEVVVPSFDEPGVNPPLFAWVEWEYYRASGDSSRLARVFPRLEAYYEWLRSNLRAAEGRGLYFQTDLGSGMDNTPRGDVAHSAWIDMSSQQALAAQALADIARVLGNGHEQKWREEKARVSEAINALLWSESDGIYYDLARDGTHASVKHIGAFWPLLAEVASSAQAQRLIEHLENPLEFRRPHRFPSLAASEPTFVADGHYWRGSVWAPTNYMVIKGLNRNGARAIGRSAAENHLAFLAQVFEQPPENESKIAPEERDGDYATFWECYSSEAAVPATRWDNTFLSRQDFVGWTGLGPIAMLIEDVLGLELIGSENRLVWHLARPDRHGLTRIGLTPHNEVSLVVDRANDQGRRRLSVTAEKAFTLEVRYGSVVETFLVEPGSSEHLLGPAR